jgi:outer membrane protein OmpA-like peptidoglycan-associated protein
VTNRLQTALTGAISLAIMLSVACAAPPKPKEMVEFEAMRASKYTKRIKEVQATEKLLAESEQFYVIALEAYDDEELDRVKEYSILGMMKYRGAESIAKKKDAKARVSAANDKFSRFQKIRNDHNTRRELLDKAVASLSREKELLTGNIDRKFQDETEAARAEREKALASLVKQAGDEITKAELAQKDAEGVLAPKHAAGPYNRGTNNLQAAKKFLNLGTKESAPNKLETAANYARDAQRDFEKAKTEASAMFAKEQETLATGKMNKELVEEAQKIFPGMVKEEGRGCVIIVDSLFKPRKAKVDTNRLYLLENVLTMAKKYPTYKVLVEGHTQPRGNNAKNLALSQTRAQVVRDYFFERNIPVDRLLTVGKGGDYPHFSGRKERKRNDRVNIVFLFPR